MGYSLRTLSSLTQRKDPEPRQKQKSNEHHDTRRATYSRSHRSRPEEPNIEARTTIPANYHIITFLSLSPTFYVYPIRQDLQQAVIHSTYPKGPTFVSRFLPDLPEKGRICPLRNRAMIVYYFKGFKQLLLQH